MAGARPGRRWFPLDTNFYRDEKTLDAGWPSAQLFIAILSYLYSTGAADGRISREATAALGVTRWQVLAARLVKAGLLDEPDPDTFMVRSWGMWQAASPGAERQRRYRERRRDDPE